MGSEIRKKSKARNLERAGFSCLPLRAVEHSRLRFKLVSDFGSAVCILPLTTFERESLRIFVDAKPGRRSVNGQLRAHRLAFGWIESLIESSIRGCAPVPVLAAQQPRARRWPFPGRG